ncbi:tRNA (adenosine(37)-N6)-threonylcarbamoyltransferase complex ATPase subunit type 1 TsaE [Sulfurimonas marina]|uniref:tRNA threonylcarbamoyladenosine biosynthesis protein TsaE n=1 Tax=Sulfurimonas marina TaxID=2590551 RepID=A0A7M1AVA7_9BACT|nr:tRNA (adenosine(37)-N6)-threonylcarbamoyltransferase complex ATPase subunit type 1 TsaE [Sulfurimonas marina]QOP41369.1 tRNA (adenosine(37)-N6)-threonylcarbamoyltransferase complex ATPase subunit type 1 TsaE [Sulfurimonas marina]
MKETTYTLGLSELDGFASEFLDRFSEGVVILKGDVAAGKTTLVKTIAKLKGICDDVTSPTFSLQQCYGEDTYHYDIYNKGLDHFVALGMLEELEKPGLHFIEWGNDELEKILDAAGFDVVSIDIDKISDDKREYTVCIR